MILPKYTLGVGDRFAHQAKAQLKACMMAGECGIEVIPVWNKSNREHMIIGSTPASVRQAADSAVGKLGWRKPYFCDADHINFDTVDKFVEACDFYTIDVADWIGHRPSSEKSAGEAADPTAFVAKHPELVGDGAWKTSNEFLAQAAGKY